MLRLPRYLSDRGIIEWCNVCVILEAIDFLKSLDFLGNLDAD